MYMTTNGIVPLEELSWSRFLNLDSLFVRVLRSAGTILARIDFFIVCPLDKAIIDSCQRRPHGGSKPVDPVISRKASRGHGTAKAPSRVQGAARIEYPCHESQFPRQMVMCVRDPELYITGK